jgi:LruC domain-containing protein
MQRSIAWLSLLAGIWTSPGLAQNFEYCPTQAFLVQDAKARLYGVDLSTGYFLTLSENLATNNKVNALGFSIHDGYLYGWSYAHKTLARVGSDYAAVPISLAQQPNSNYYVGDVAVTENAYYMYRKGGSAAHGLWRIDLDPESSSHLQPQRITSGMDLHLNIYDFAFHPELHMLYSVTKPGELVSIDPITGDVEFLADVGVKGTFGAVYFDVNGLLYVSRNRDGVIFRIDPLASAPTAEKYAQGPASANNDGARCALATVEPQVDSSIDFGDAPESYGTVLADNGPRHNLADGLLRLGNLLDGESQAYPAPLADDSTESDDEDGVEFITELAAGETALVEVATAGNGYLSAWIDFDRNGQFDIAEQIFADRELASGTRILDFTVPVWAESGNSWARFRFSSVAGLDALGGAPDGEVEDHPTTLFNGGVSTTHYPGADSFVTLAFEDLWPSRGDYDMNDLVLHYRTSINTINNGSNGSDAKVVGLNISGQVTAVGANFHSGFAVQVPGIKRGDIDPDSIFFEINGVKQTLSPLENAPTSQADAVFKITRDVWDIVATAEGCSFYRTEANCGSSPVQASFSLNARIRSTVPLTQLDGQLFNPFIFATTGYQRNSIFPEPPGRELEVHLKNRQPTIHADLTLLGRADDVSVPNSTITYQTANGLPWALEIGAEWHHPREYQDLVQAYPDFIHFVTSGGTTHQQWFLLEKAAQDKLYED